MRTTLSFEDFRDAFRAHNRLDTFSYDGARILYNYLEQLDPDYELDVIALCCDFSDDDVETIIQDYGIEIDPESEDREADVLDWLQDRTIVVGTYDAGCRIVYCTSF